jgi:hypothetical protein
MSYLYNWEWYTVVMVWNHRDILKSLECWRCQLYFVCMCVCVYTHTWTCIHLCVQLLICVHSYSPVCAGVGQMSYSGVFLYCCLCLISWNCVCRWSWTLLLWPDWLGYPCLHSYPWDYRCMMPHLGLSVCWGLELSPQPCAASTFLKSHHQ